MQECSRDWSQLNQDSSLVAAEGYNQWIRTGSTGTIVNTQHMGAGVF